jgi:hypothetical protein
VRRKIEDASLGGELLHHVPNYLFCHTFAPSPSRPVDAAKQLPTADTSPAEPILKHLSDPVGQRDGANVTGFADQIHDGPVRFSLLDVVECQLHEFVPA